MFMGKDPWLLLRMWINEVELKFIENPYSLLKYVTWNMGLHDGYGIDNSFVFFHEIWGRQTIAVSATGLCDQPIPPYPLLIWLKYVTYGYSRIWQYLQPTRLNLS